MRACELYYDNIFNLKVACFSPPPLPGPRTSSPKLISSCRSNSRSRTYSGSPGSSSSPDALGLLHVSSQVSEEGARSRSSHHNTRMYGRDTPSFAWPRTKTYTKLILIVSPPVLLFSLLLLDWVSVSGTPCAIKSFAELPTPKYNKSDLDLRTHASKTLLIPRTEPTQ